MHISIAVTVTDLQTTEIIHMGLMT